MTDMTDTASVSAIYGLGDPDSYLKMMLHLQQGGFLTSRTGSAWGVS